ncbi:putative phosphonate catabolism associated alcohol dehydrogenase [Microbacterium resistens]|uniref:alcohol dehydrogenase n=1 Tax=Microbacterium resistens TaxID=156977 RepID=A0ABU1SC53_9MICO|nr:alcohol dehydrogenase catalytic domain-containing protein [Microbacterium resistens]MDR6867196.1 putative phosphonate catabolism associated alcohol dehydrogenase [Microbacterium resistens]
MRAVLAPSGEPVHRHDVTLRPAATAMVWIGPGQPHQAMAVPGVALAPHDVLVAVELSTICGSDILTVQGRRPAPAPLVLGHESVGRVIAIGESGSAAVDGSPLRVGDRVVWSMTVSCGACDRCASGIPQRCRRLATYGHARIEPRWELTGGFGGHVHLRDGTAIVRVPEALPAATLAPVPCATALAWAALARAGRVHEPSGARVVVFGAGMVGLTAAAIAVEEGATVLLVDSDPGRRAIAGRFGLVATTPDAVAEAAADIVIEASGRDVSAAIAAADVGGAVVLVGSVFPTESAGPAGTAGSVPDPGPVAPVSPDPVALDSERIVRGLVTVAGVDGYTGEELAAAVAFMAGRGRAYPFAELVGAIHPLAAVDEALAAAASPDAPLRVGLAPR